MKDTTTKSLNHTNASLPPMAESARIVVLGPDKGFIWIRPVRPIRVSEIIDYDHDYEHEHPHEISA